MNWKHMLAPCLVMVGLVSVTGCASSYAPPEPVIAHVDNAAKTLEENPWKATHFKLGARWFPRCIQGSSIGTRLPDQGTLCLTDEEIQAISYTNSTITEEFTSRANRCAGACPGGP